MWKQKQAAKAAGSTKLAQAGSGSNF